MTPIRLLRWLKILTLRYRASCIATCFLDYTTEAPAAPVMSAPLKDQTFTSSSIPIQGKADPETLVTIFIDNNKVGEVEVQDSGAWTFETPALPDGPHSVYATATDEAGNESIKSEVIAFAIETGKDRAPRILTPKQATRISKSPLTLSGEGKPNSSIRLFVNNKMVGSVRIPKDGKWAYNLPVKEGEYEVFAAATADKKLKSETLRFTVDFTPPKEGAKERVPGKGLFNGNAEPGSVVTLFLDGAQIAKVITDEEGTWSYTPARGKPIEKGRHLLRVSITDKNGKITTLIDQEVSL